MQEFIDLRSDTVTVPSPEMRLAMQLANVGDDVYGEDPTVKQLQDKVALLLGKEAALFVPTGTMSNQLAIGVQTNPGDELLIEPTHHIALWEGGAPARLWGVSLRTIEGKSSGILDQEDILCQMRPEDIHFPRTKMISLENTLNRAGGKVYPLATIEAISSWAKTQKLTMHLDGARLFNAVIASGIPAAVWASHFDSVSLCLSKGLGAPVGSLLVGSTQTITKARRLRKVLGGGWRQAGVLAAAGLYALENNIQKLHHDHFHAKLLSDTILQTDGFSLEFGETQTNLVWIKIDPSLGTAAQIIQGLKSQGILMSALGPQLVRACTHLNISLDNIQYVCDVIKRGKYR